MTETSNSLLLAMDVRREANFTQIFAATCAQTFDEASRANNPYYLLCGFLLGIWFDPIIDRTVWATAVLKTADETSKAFMHRAHETADIFASDNFRKSINDAVEKTGHKFNAAFVHILAQDFLEFAQLKEMPPWDEKHHAKAVAHFLGFALSMWSLHPAVASMYSLKLRGS